MKNKNYALLCHTSKKLKNGQMIGKYFKLQIQLYCMAGHANAKV
jgi:hypothetical protein